jgi:hypothetical protein
MGVGVEDRQGGGMGRGKRETRYRRRTVVAPHSPNLGAKEPQFERKRA